MKQTNARQIQEGACVLFQVLPMGAGSEWGSPLPREWFKVTSLLVFVRNKGNLVGVGGVVGPSLPV